MRLCWIMMLLFTALIPSVPARAASVRIAVVQLSSSDTGDFGKMLVDARFAKAAGAQLLVFPETADMGWLNPRAFFDATEIPGAVTDRFADIARATGLWVVAGLAERGKRVATQPPTYEVYDSAVMIDPSGAIVLRHRQFNVVKNAFSVCPAAFGAKGCGYTPGPLSETKVAATPFGLVGLFVCDDAFTNDTSSLDALKVFHPNLVIIPWGITAGSQAECGKDGFNATGFAAQAAAYLKTAYVIGANATGKRTYGRFLPSWYCGTSGFAKPTGEIGGGLNTQVKMGLFDVPVGP